MAGLRQDNMRPDWVWALAESFAEPLLAVLLAETQDWLRS
jgi:hypothetical protein